MLQANRTLPPELLGYDAQAKLIALDSAYGIVEFDLEGNIVLVNELFCSFVGYSKEALIGAPHTMLLTPADRVQHNGFWQEVNDEYGHQAGDEVLKELAQLLLGQFRDIDIIARIGGEEFIVLLKGATRELAIKIMDRCREQIERHRFEHGGQTIRFTISVGVAAFYQRFHSIDEWIHDADTLLYHSKHAGRNRVR